jgi:3-hydroxyacyl-CoA dehydrogenase
MAIKKIACPGVGVIGSSWVTSFALKGYTVSAQDSVPEALPLAKERIETNLGILVKNKVIKAEDVAKIMGRITFTTNIGEALTGAQFVQETTLENYETKHAVVEEFNKYAPEDAIFASSTSGLYITEIAKPAKHPENFIGAHPYNPPHLIPLVEISKGEKTSDATIQRGKDFYISLGKEPVVLNKEALGFISNRLSMAVEREIAELVLRGVCSVEDADKALTFGPGLRWAIMGPNLVYQLGGGKGGIKGLFAHTGKSANMWLADMASWPHYPEGWWDRAQKELDESIPRRPKEIGNTQESLAEYRDNMLIALLQLHKKL